jgi:hypothetical protein
LNIENVFTVDTVNMKKLFADDQEKCFYIPAYQRPYSWQKEDINRMWQDIAYGLEQLNSSDDYITFLGSIITMHDIKHQSIAPIVRGEVPSKVMVIIDGQQRLTTLLLLIVSLDNAIRKRLTIENEKTLSKLLDTLSIASRMYKSPKSYGLNDSKDYPKIIRAYDDQWATNKQEKYDSPIAKFLKKYIDFVEDQSNKRKRFVYSSDTSSNNESHDNIKRNMKVFVTEIDSFLKNKNDIHQMMIDKSKLLDVEGSLIDEIKDELDHNQEKKEIFVLLLIMRFVLQRVFVADIVAKKEDYAFEMFDSLNTTGDPLTAFETFKPKVVEHEGLAKYFDSDSKEYMDNIEMYLNYEPKKRNTITTQLITTFALSEDGTTLSKKLRDQRVYLRNAYSTVDDKKEFVGNLSNVSTFYHIWNKSNTGNDNEILVVLNNDKIALTCLQFLSKTKHIIAIALLSRFYEKHLNDDSNYEFTEAIKCITAFFVIWRSARSGTAGIDNCYRKLMSAGIKLQTTDDELPQETIQSFNRQNKSSEITVEELKRALRYFLSKGATDKIEIFSKDTWLKRLKNVEIYLDNKEVCKFLLIAAFDGGIAHKKGSGVGLIQKARSGISETLEKSFNNSLFESIEHISPSKNGWSGVTDERKNTLGNLTLLPQRINSSAGSRSLKEKELMFKALCAKTQDEQEKLLEENNISFKENTKSILAESQHFPYLESLSDLQGWSDESIEVRTDNLGGIVWDRLAIDWLGFEMKS